MNIMQKKTNKQTNKQTQQNKKNQINSLTENQLYCSVWYQKRFKKKKSIQHWM